MFESIQSFLDGILPNNTFQAICIVLVIIAFVISFVESVCHFGE